MLDNELHVDASTTDVTTDQTPTVQVEEKAPLVAEQTPEVVQPVKTEAPKPLEVVQAVSTAVDVSASDDERRRKRYLGYH